MKVAAGLFLVLLFVSTALAGVVDQGLLAKIEKSDPQTLHSVIIFMQNQADITAMKHHHDLIQATRQERHRDVILSLQQTATETQADLLNYLVQGKHQGTVGEYRGFWIANMIIGELNRDEIMKVAARGDVATVYSDFKGEQEKPIIDGGYAPPSITSVEPGLRAVRADSAWAMGYTGAGRLVCNIDTGVDGTHPALVNRWRGNNGYSATESWLDTTNPNSHFPHDDGNPSHGTHTMGTICGRSQTTPDTIGVAIDAQWIAAMAVDVTGGNISAAFQWAADPDGDPNSVEDVPDAISNSWGSIPVPPDVCPPDFYSLIDNCEAAGAAVVFAAGNEGSGPMTLRIPANRITTDYNCFSVGAVDASGNIASFSSRGPSQCDSSTIKPEVSAPGVNIRSSVRGGTYEGNWSGTSMATPHIAGAIAILRQVNPNASVDTMKWALMHSARDRGNPGEDNNYGWGIINIKQAIAFLPPNNIPFIFPNAAYVVDGNDDYPDPGETINLFVRLKNTGTAASNVAAVLSTSEPHTTITQDSAFYGNIALNDTAVSTTPYTMSFADNTPPGTRVAFNLTITADSGYVANKHLALLVGRLADLGIATHDTGNVNFTISNFGAYGLDPAGMNPAWQGRGFRIKRTGTDYLFEGSVMIGVGPTQVSNAARDENQNPTSDFLALTAIDTLEPGPFGIQEYHTVYNDQGSPAPLNIQVTQKSFAFAAPDTNYIIMEYTITNSGSAGLDSVLIAHFEDWDIPWGSPNDHVGFDRARKLGYQYSGANYRGQQVLSDLGIFSFKAIDNANEVYPPHFTRADKWALMNAGISDTAITITDASMMITTGPYTIAPGDSVVAAFAIMGANSLTNIRTIATAALARYPLVGINDDKIIKPSDISLSQNYPNPFNARTTINFATPTKGQARLEAFDILGRRVAVLFDGIVEPGTHSVNWDCSQIPSGVYFYRLTAGDKSSVKKMTLLK